MPKSSNNRISVEGNYSTVDDNMPKSSNNIIRVEGNYSTVNEDTSKSSTNRLSMDGNYSTVELDEHSDINCSYSVNSELGQAKRKPKPTINPKPKSSCVNSEENRSSDKKIRHITPPNGSDNVYPIVDKSSKMYIQLMEVKGREHVNLIKPSLLWTKHGSVNLVWTKQIKGSSK